MGKIRPFRYWFYLRTGYQLYFAFVFAIVNTLTITYFLAIEKAPFLKEVFPNFITYAIFLIAIGLPILIGTGFIHFKKIPAFKSETEVAVESNPFNYKLPTAGYIKKVKFPLDLLMSRLMIKVLSNEKLTEDEIKEMKEIQKNMELLIKGGYVGLRDGHKLPFQNENQEKKESKK